MVERLFAALRCRWSWPKTAKGVTTQYLIDDLSPTGYPQVVEELVNGQVRRKYTYGLERISELQQVNGAPTASFYQYDGRGTVRMLTNSAGAVTDLGAARIISICALDHLYRSRGNA